MSRRVLAVLFVLAAALVPASAGEVELPNPLKNVKVGQWVSIRMVTLFGIAEQKQTVTAIQGEGDDRVLTIKSEMIIEDEMVDSREDNTTYATAIAEQREALAEAENLNITNVKATVKGEEVDAVQVEFTQEDQQCRLILSEKIPLIGMVRMELEGMDEPAIEVLDFGE